VVLSAETAALCVAFVRRIVGVERKRFDIILLEAAVDESPRSTRVAAGSS
jgi:hypothetical protein